MTLEASQKVRCCWLLAFSMLSANWIAAQQQEQGPNIMVALSYDHRYNAMGFTSLFEALETPAFDEVARDDCFGNTF